MPRMTPRTDDWETHILEQAAVSPNGIALEFSSVHEMKRCRRRLYAARVRLRSLNEAKYDGLSLICRNDKELLIVRRDRIQRPLVVHPVAVRQLEESELPDIVRSRGPTKFVFHRIS